MTTRTKDCPKCGEPMTHQHVPCPDGLPGCLVVHYAWVCHHCRDKLPTFDEWYKETYGVDPKGQILDEVTGEIGNYISAMVRRAL